MGPTRTCLGCGQKRPRPELLRLAVTKDGELALDQAKSMPGRGAWLCGAGCLGAAAKKKVFGRAFRGKATRVDLERLEQLLRGLG